ncbi:MAG: DUF790 family protein, partial [Gemmataceae bacterium]
MLVGNQVRVRVAKNGVTPVYLKKEDSGWLGSAEQLLFVYREIVGRTRGELEAELAAVIGEGPGQLVMQGLAKLLEDRCEWESSAEQSPEQLREVVFRQAALARLAGTFDRATVMAAAQEELKLATEVIDRGLFADLRDEQRVLSFEDCTAEFLVNRYNVALAQGVVLRAQRLTIDWKPESPARLRQFIRALKFHRLIAEIEPLGEGGYRFQIDGPLSLFQSTQKYGLQLAFFLPTLLHGAGWELRAALAWGPKKDARSFTLRPSDGLRPLGPETGQFVPPELTAFCASFAEKKTDWELSDAAHLVPLPGSFWVPDLTLTHRRT